MITVQRFGDHYALSCSCLDHGTEIKLDNCMLLECHPTILFGKYLLNPTVFDLNLSRFRHDDLCMFIAGVEIGNYFQTTSELEQKAIVLALRGYKDAPSITD